MTLPPSLLEALQPWADLYGNSQPVSVGITFLHLAGVMIAGGTAVGADWQALRAGDLRAREVALERMRGSHTTVVAALAVIVLSGVAMAAADLATFAASAVYLWKMLLFVMLMGNGALLVGAERRGRTGSALRVSGPALVSLVLWLVILLLGTILKVSA